MSLLFSFRFQRSTCELVPTFRLVNSPVSRQQLTKKLHSFGTEKQKAETRVLIGADFQEAAPDHMVLL